MANIIARCFLLIFANIILLSCTEVTNVKSTAAENVTVLEKTFVIQGLDRQRQIRIYLPPDYHASKQRYAVLYMHDGQNLFDDATAYIGEWSVDETLNRLSQTDNLSLIVVGIDNGLDKRMNELSPWPNSKFGAAQGKQYMQFIVEQVKPYIDTHYRSLSDQQNTAIMGSSMGGLISHYAIFEYPQIFSKAGIFSPSFWYSENVYEFSRTSQLKSNSRLYFLMGAKEGQQAVDGMNLMTQTILAQGFPQSNLYTKVVAEGEHNETLWKAEFEQAVLWLFNKQAN